MSDKTALGDRMKRYEQPTRFVLPRRTYTILRVDGRAFHRYLRGAQRPYDAEFATAMDKVAQALCAEITGAQFAYTQSDEISVLYTDFSSHQTEPWFGGVLAKQLSIGASIATQTLNAEHDGRAHFDARVFTMSDAVEVANHFLWRQQDAVRNSIAMAAQAKFSHKQLHGVNTDQMQAMLWEQHRINWNDYPVRFKRGGITVKDTREREVTYTDRTTQTERSVVATRTTWESRPAPHFVVRPGEWLARHIPALHAFEPLDDFHEEMAATAEYYDTHCSVTGDVLEDPSHQEPAA